MKPNPSSTKQGSANPVWGKVVASEFYITLDLASLKTYSAVVNKLFCGTVVFGSNIDSLIA